MASITIRRLEDGVKERLRVRAFVNRRSMEEEARQILRDAVGPEPKPKSDKRKFSEIAREIFGPENGVDLKLPRRTPLPEPMSFD